MHSKSAYARFGREVDAFGTLRQLAMQMIEEGGTGVTRTSGGAHIDSYDDFFDYVKRHRPELVATPDAPNPFPGILNGASYEHLRGTPASQDDLLLWSDQVHDRPFGKVQLGITCEGTGVNLKDPK